MSAAAKRSPEFALAQERIRKIRQGLDPDAPDGEEDTLEKVLEGVESEGERAQIAAEAAAVEFSQPGSLDEKKGEVEKQVAAQAAKEKQEEEEKSGGIVGWFGFLGSEFKATTLPEFGDVVSTFGVVVVFVFLYAGYILAVDVGSKTAFSPFFQEYYDAMKPPTESQGSASGKTGEPKTAPSGAETAPKAAASAPAPKAEAPTPAPKPAEGAAFVPQFGQSASEAFEAEYAKTLGAAPAPAAAPAKPPATGKPL